MEVTRKQGTSNFPKNKHWYFLIRTCTYMYLGKRNVGFSEDLVCFVFLLHPFWDSLLGLNTEWYFIFLNFLDNCRGVFGTTPIISNEVFCENSYQLKAINYFHKTLHLRCSAGFWIRLWIEYSVQPNMS